MLCSRAVRLSTFLAQQWLRTSCTVFVSHCHGKPRYESPLNAMRVLSGMEEPSIKRVPVGTPPGEFPGKKNDDDKKDDDGSLVGRLKVLIRDYGYIVIPVHLALSAMWFTAIYSAISAGVDLSEWVKWVGSHEKIARLGPFTATIVCLKLLAPIRYLMTIAVTTMTIRVLTRRGVIKSAGEIREQIQEKYEEKKDQLKDKFKDGDKEK